MMIMSNIICVSSLSTNFEVNSVEKCDKSIIFSFLLILLSKCLSRKGPQPNLSQVRDKNNMYYTTITSTAFK